MSGTPWPNLLADLEAKRAAIDHVITLVRTHFIGDTVGEMPASPVTAPPAAAEPRPKRTLAAAVAACGQSPATRTTTRAEPSSDVSPQVAAAGDRVVAALKVKSPQKPGDLQTVARLEGYAWRKLLGTLEEEGRIVRQGTGRGAVVTLPGRPAKERL